MDYNRNGGKPDSDSPQNQPVDGIVYDWDKFKSLHDVPRFLGLCEFDKAELDLHPTLLVQVRGIAWYVEDESGVSVQDDDSNVFVIMHDTLNAGQDIKNLDGKQHANIGERLGWILEKVSDGKELCTLQFRILIRQDRKQKTNLN